MYSIWIVKIVVPLSGGKVSEGFCAAAGNLGAGYMNIQTRCVIAVVPFLRVYYKAVSCLNM